jgi:hypothetical protein
MDIIYHSSRLSSVTGLLIFIQIYSLLVPSICGYQEIVYLQRLRLILNITKSDILHDR